MAEIKVIVSKHCHKSDGSHLENVVLTQALVSGCFHNALNVPSVGFTNITRPLMSMPLWFTCEIRAISYPNFIVGEMRYQEIISKV